MRAALRETHLAPAHLGSRCNFQTLPELLAVSATEYPRGKWTVPTNSETSPVLADENYARQLVVLVLSSEHSHHHTSALHHISTDYSRWIPYIESRQSADRHFYREISISFCRGYRGNRKATKTVASRSKSKFSSLVLPLFIHAGEDDIPVAFS